MTTAAIESLIPIDQPLPSKPGKLWNRNHATQRLAEEIGRTATDATYEFSILLVEFAGLSDITDRLGYAPADDVWRRVLSTLVGDLRSHDLCCRLGGDDFILIVPGKGERETQTLADRLRRRWAPAPGSRESAIELNIGVASCPTHGTTIESLLGTADLATQSDKLRTTDHLRPSEQRALSH